MNKKQQKQIVAVCKSVLKWTATVMLAFGLTMQLATSSDENILIGSLSLIFTGVILFIIYSIWDHDKSTMLLSSIGFAVVVGALLDTETARIIAEHSGLAITDEVGFFTKYGKIIISVLKAFA